ncbi:MAG: cell surface protein SprA [Ignavibacteriae bacterium]|nr:cell surface protein SprA [Ignavibacteriota bacterium]
MTFAHIVAVVGLSAAAFGIVVGLAPRPASGNAISMHGARQWNALYSDSHLPRTDSGKILDAGLRPESGERSEAQEVVAEAGESRGLTTFDLNESLSVYDSSRVPDNTAATAYQPGTEGDDSLTIVSDSTNRIRFLPDRRRQGAVARPFPERMSPAYLQPSEGYGIQRVVKVDSTRNVVIIREQVNGRDVRIPYEMPLEEYIQQRYDYERNRRTAEFIAKRNDSQAGKLEGLLKNISEFDIPVPPNPLMSIFGDRNRISLRISGSIDINAGFRIEKSDQQSVFMRQTQFSPNFRQQVNVNVNGLIGDKLSIRADWSTERTFDYENQLKIKYTGYDDEIVKSIEAGNVSLQTPSQLVGGSGALFGIKAEFQFGPLHLSTVASQKKGESNKLSVAGGATEQKFERHAYDYAENHYFVSLDYREPDPNKGGANVYESYYNYRADGGTAPLILRPDLQIRDMEVWITRPASVGSVSDPEERPGVAFIDMPNFLYFQSSPTLSDSVLKYADGNLKVESQSGIVEVGNFKKLKKDADYTYNPTTGILTMTQSVQEDQVIAVAYRVVGADQAGLGDYYYGTFVSDQRFVSSSATPRLVLKLVKPKNLSPAFTKAWKHRVRSIYSLNMRNIKKEDLANFRIVYRQGGTPDDENMPGTFFKWLRLFGIDYSDDNATGQPDGKIDFIPGLTIDYIRGEIIFPTLEPWNEGLKALYARLPGTNVADVQQYLYPEVYTSTKTIARQSQNDKIMIVGTTKGSSSSTYYLGFNVVPGSVRVRLNGQPLAAGSDFTVDEQAGQVRLIKEEALVPGAKVEIEYEKQDLFSFASKTLLGARGEVDFGKESFLGFTLLSLNQKTLSDKVRIGEEPISNTMFGVDARTRIDLPFITDALNTLPFIQTKDKSSLSMQGEAAVILPDPNTKISPIPSDQGKGIAYIDDFEGARVYIPLQTAYSAWKIASVPKSVPGIDAASDSIMNGRRAKLNWYNVPISSSSNRSVVVTDIWPNKLAAREDQRVTVLDLDFKPDQRGAFNYSPDLAAPSQTWNGIMRTLPVNATNLVDGNYNYIELWMRVESLNQGSKLLIDLGKVTEDVIPNGVLNSEDLVNPASIRNGILNPGEDIGLDMLTDAEERALYPSLGDDPSLDNYSYNINNWDAFNGTQTNIDDAAGQFPDTEDLNNNGILDLTNDYFQYEIDLDTTKFSLSLPPSQRNPWVVGGGTNGWYQFRIPLTNARVVGTPALDNVEYVRVLMTGMERAGIVRIAEFNFVGNQWYERERSDPSFTVSVVNVEDNPEYTSPPGVVRERDRRRPDQVVYMNEQSLALAFHNLPDTTYREAYRLFPATGVDMFNYESLKMYVHGEQSLGPDDYEVVMRFGIDTANYYEYRAPAHPGWDSKNEIAIRFANLTAIKTLRDTCSKVAEVDAENLGGAPGSKYRVVGCPDVVSVRFISVGVRNLHVGQTISGQIWINELRVVGPNKTKGMAYTGSMNLRMADIADISASMSHTDPYFHSLSERFSSSRASTTTWSMNTTLNIDKAFPKDWQGTQVRVTYSHSENLSKPLLLPGQPDVEVEGSLRILAEELRRQGRPQQEIDVAVRDARLAAQTLEIRDSWAIPTVRLKAPGKHWLIEDFVNRLELSYNYSIVRFRDPTIQRRRNWQWQARVGYGYDFGREAFIKPFSSIFDGVFLLDFYKDAKFYYLPSRINLGADLNRSRIEEQRRNPPEFRPFIREFSHNRSMNISFTLAEQSLLNLSGSYNSSLQTSLLHLETDYAVDEFGMRMKDAYGADVVTQRKSSTIFREIFFGKGSLYFGIPIRYTQQFSLNSRPLLPRFFDLDRYFDMSGGYTVNYTWQENLQQLGLGRQASYNASVNWSVNLRLKSLFDPLFDTKDGGPAAGGPAGAGRQISMPEAKRPNATAAIDDAKRDLIKRQKELKEAARELQQKNPKEFERVQADLKKSEAELNRLIGASTDTTSVATAIVDSAVDASSGFDVEKFLKNAAYYAIKVPFLDYENISFTFSETNQSTVTGVRGATGFSVFWTTDPFGNPADAGIGPSRLYQLGLVSDPNPASGSLGFKNSFPFIGIDNFSRGLRAPNPNGIYTDNFSQSNTIAIKTNRPLWEGARIELNWDLRWSVNKNYQFSTDSLGIQTITSLTSTGQLERSYLAFPDFLFFSFFNTNIEAVNARYKELMSDAGDRRSQSEKLTQAFEEGFEAIPWLTRVLGGFLPRVNWGLRWDGIEKIGFMQSVADRIGLEHRYSSTMTTAFRYDQSTGERNTESKRIGYNFSPLIGLSLGFNKLWGGDMTVTARWGKQRNFDLNSSANNIVEQSTDEVSITANFRKTGIEMPLLGLTLKNDIDFSFSFSLNKSASHVYEVVSLDSGGQPREGTTKITIEPRVRYVISQRVQSSVFYRFQQTKPDSSVGSRIPGTTIHEGGLELRISITGS